MSFWRTSRGDAAAATWIFRGDESRPTELGTTFQRRENISQNGARARTRERVAGINSISSLHQTEVLAELGVVFFLFEMGLELSVAKIGAMRSEIFGLGAAQFLATALVIAKAGQAVGAYAGAPLSPPAAVAVGGALALSSSARPSGNPHARVGSAFCFKGTTPARRRR